MKKFIALLCTLCMIATMVPFAVMAEDAEPVVLDLGTEHGMVRSHSTAYYDGMTKIGSSKIYYSISEDGKTLTIKGEGVMPNSGSNANTYPYYGNKNITKVVVGEGITGIGQRAFETMSNLAEIELPTTLLSIDQYAFNGVTKLTHIEIPEGCTTLQNNWISNCSGIQTIKLPTTITTMGYPDGVTLTDANKRYPRGAQKAEWIVYEGSFAAEKLESNSFDSNGVYTINLGVDTTKQQAKITKVAAPAVIKGVMKTYTKEPQDTARDTTATTTGGIPWSVDVASKSLTLSVTLTNASTKTATHKGLGNLYQAPWFRYNNIIEHVVFDNTAGATTLELPRQLLSYLTNVEELTIPWYATKFGWAVCHTAGYKNVYIEDGPVELGDNFFISCANLTEVRLPNTLDLINTRSFNGCSSLKELTLPASLNTIGTSTDKSKDAFADCTITLKYYKNSKSAAAVDTYKAATQMTTISYETLNKAEGYLKDTAGEENAFKWVLDTDKKSLVVSKVDEVESNGKIQTFTDRVPGQPVELLAPWHYFGTAGAIDNVVIGEGITHIPSQVLRENGVYAKVTLPSTLKSSSSYAFNAAKVSELYIKEGATLKGAQMVNDNSDIQKFILPSTMTPAKDIIRDFTFGSRGNMAKKSIVIVAPYASPAYSWAQTRYAEALAAGDGYKGMPADKLTILESYKITANDNGAVTVVNNTGRAVDSAYVIVAYYDDAELSNLSAAKLSTVQTLASASNTVATEAYADAAGKTVRVYLWNNMNELKPMADVFGE